MIKLLQYGIILMQFILSNQNISAQSESNFKKIETENFNGTTVSGIKIQSGSMNPNKDLKEIDSTKSSIGNSSNNNIQKGITSESVQFDYNQMPSDVQLKMNENKSSEKNLFDGIVKGFTLEIKTCTDFVSTQEKLSFLTNQFEFLKIEFISIGIIKIIVMPEVDSVDLKNKMLTAGISFSFLNEFFLLNK